jgi:predicted XRE-type DNA-binding protein
MGCSGCLWGTNEIQDWSLGQNTNEYLMLWECPAPWDRTQTSVSCYENVLLLGTERKRVSHVMRISCSLGQNANEYLMLWECPAPWGRTQTSISCYENVLLLGTERKRVSHVMRMSCSLGQNTNECLMLWECPAPWDRTQTSVSCYENVLLLVEKSNLQNFIMTKILLVVIWWLVARRNLHTLSIATSFSCVNVNKLHLIGPSQREHFTYMIDL